MPTGTEVDPNQLERWFDQNIVAILVLAGLLLVLYIFSGRFVHIAVARALAAQAGQLEVGGIEAAELQKRAATLESLITTILRILVIAFIIVLIIGFLGLWSILAGIGLLLAALTLAGQPIVLDYLMGILIILEGQYFKGDVIQVGTNFGTVEDVGLRRTTIRAPDGTVHTISNGEIRVVANRTRIFAAAEVVVHGIREEDFEEALALMDRVGQDVAADPDLATFIIEAPEVRFVGDPDDLGMSATMRGKVIASQRWAVATATRKRLNRAFLEAGIELNKRGVVPRVARGEGQGAPLYVPEDAEGAEDA